MIVRVRVRGFLCIILGSLPSSINHHEATVALYTLSTFHCFYLHFFPFVIKLEKEKTSISWFLCLSDLKHIQSSFFNVVELL